MTGQLVHLRNVGREPIDIVQDDGTHRIEPGEAFNADERMATLLTKLAKGAVIIEAEAVDPQPRDQLIVPRNAGDLQALLASATAR